MHQHGERDRDRHRHERDEAAEEEHRPLAREQVEPRAVERVRVERRQDRVDQLEREQQDAEPAEEHERRRVGLGAVEHPAVDDVDQVDELRGRAELERVEGVPTRAPPMNAAGM